MMVTISAARRFRDGRIGATGSCWIAMVLPVLFDVEIARVVLIWCGGASVMMGAATAATSVSAVSRKRNRAGARRSSRAAPIPISAMTADCHAALMTNVTTASAMRSMPFLLHQLLQPPQRFRRQLLRFDETHHQRLGGASENALHHVAQRRAERFLARD